jgi:hypothetical protein
MKSSANLQHPQLPVSIPDFRTLDNMSLSPIYAVSVSILYTAFDLSNCEIHSTIPGSISSGLDSWKHQSEVGYMLMWDRSMQLYFLVRHFVSARGIPYNACISRYISNCFSRFGEVVE